MMWQILQNLDDLVRPQNLDTSTAIGKYKFITAQNFQLEKAASNVCKPDLEPEIRSRIDEMGYTNVVDNLCSLKDELGSRSLTLGLLRNLPNVTFKELFDTLSPYSQDTVKYCSNGESSCGNIETLFPSQFPKCFGYNTLEQNSSNTLSDEGISNGVTMVLMIGNELASVIMPYISLPGMILARSST